MTAPAEILRAVHLATGCEPEAITSKSRRHSVLFPRYIALLMLREARPFHSIYDIGLAFGLQGEGTAQYALKKARAMLQTSAEFLSAYERATAISASQTAP